MTNEIITAFTNLRQPHVARQHGYWKALTPLTPDDRFRRWLFAFLSVHTTWQNNVRAYRLMRELYWLKRKDLLAALLRRSGVGLHNMRTEYIWQFKKQFYLAPGFFERHAGETWVEARNRIAENVAGLGYAKTSFALELCYPTIVECVCLDVHMLRLYGHEELNGRSGRRFQKDYTILEADWLARCRQAKIPSYVVRQVLWDRLRRKPNSRYWSYCLE
jgi:thermostable 8-oxoguanine DNA glycosylase